MSDNIDHEEFSPLELFENLAQGTDPREVNPLFTAIMELNDDNFGDAPSLEDWENLVALAKTCKPANVPVATSLAAAKALAEYKFPKRKSIEITTDTQVEELAPLTEEELELFDEWFNTNF